MNRWKACLALLLGVTALPAMADTFSCHAIEGVNSGNADAGVTTAGEVFFGTWVGGVGGTSAMPLGGTASSEPAAVPGAMYVRGGNNELWEVVPANNTGVWTSLGGQITWNPAAVDTGNSRIVFYRGTNREIWYRERVNGVWGPHTSLGGVANSSPVAVSWGNGHVAVFNRGQNSDLWYRERIGGVWSAWTGLGGSFSVDPTVVTRGTGYYDVFVRGSGNNTYWIGYNGQWNGWVNIDGPPGGSLSEPGAARIGNYGLVVFTRGSMNANGANWKPIYKRRTLDGGITWSGWELLHPQFQNSSSNPEAINYFGGYLVAMANATGYGRMEYCVGSGT